MIFLFSKDMFTSVHFHIFPGLLDLWIILLFFQRILSIEYYKINACFFFKCQKYENFCKNKDVAFSFNLYLTNKMLTSLNDILDLKNSKEEFKEKVG